MPSSGANLTSPFVAGDVEFRPVGFTGTITDDWATVPFCDNDFAPYNNTADDHLVTIHNPTTGVGDICRYMGVIDGANWRMPTAAEIAELYGSDQINGGEATIPPGNGGWAEGSFTPLSGYALGTGQSGVKITGSGTAARVTGADPYTNGALFLLASGCRNDRNGAIVCIGETGAQAVFLVGEYLNSYLCSMELKDIMQSFLPREVVELFEIVKIDDKPLEWRMDIYLDERKVIPNYLKDSPVIAYGFVEAATIQDFPIRGKRVYLHLRRRKWLNKSENTIHTTQFDITYPGTQLTEELVAFLKATN